MVERATPETSRGQPIAAMATSWEQRGADWRVLCPVLWLSFRSREKQGKALVAIKETGGKAYNLEAPWHSGGVGEVRRARKLFQGAFGM